MTCINGQMTEMKQNWPGWLLCFVCGLLDTTCFVALGGTFVGLMTGNLILMGVSFGELGISNASMVFLLPLAGYSLGAFAAGGLRLLKAPLFINPLWIGCFILLITTVMVWTTLPQSHGLATWLVVTATAIYMGFQSGCLYLLRKGHMTTNVMTSTLSAFLADAPAQLISHHLAWGKGIAIASFLLGAVLAGVLNQIAGIGQAYTVALLLALAAIWGEVRQMRSSETQNQ
jgi:uncharacterized membrane protein YoaK (UPF0700 family)